VVPVQAALQAAAMNMAATMHAMNTILLLLLLLLLLLGHHF
jgi:hypothetical protein